MNYLDIKKSDIRYFDFAQAEAEKSDFPRFRVGCCIVYKGHILSSAHNSEKEAPIQKKYNRYRHFKNYHSHVPVKHSLHAEIAAIKKIPYPIAQQVDWKKVKVYVYRIAPGLPNGRGLARPCAGCLQCLKDMGIRDIYYSTDFGFAHERIDDD